MRSSLVHRLRFSWTGWPASGEQFPRLREGERFETLVNGWSGDGMTLVQHTWSPEEACFDFKVVPEIAPTFFAARVKGRLQHALREAGIPVAFSRKIAVRALGNMRTDNIESYLSEQLSSTSLADDRYVNSLHSQWLDNPTVDLDSPIESRSGRYWYSLHLVLSTGGRFRIGREDYLPGMRDCVLAWGDDSGCAIRAFSVMPDHVHVALRGTVDTAPSAIAMGLLRALNSKAGCRLFSERIYIGSFSAYSAAALEGRADSPAG